MYKKYPSESTSTTSWYGYVHMGLKKPIEPLLRHYSAPQLVLNPQMDL